jgi:2-oxo-4-hydroxy-4-carboxy-5-ureidoimidazoline decarboxylase
MSPAKAQPAKAQPAEAPPDVSLAEFNGMPALDARRLLLACCAAERWAGQLAAARPFGSLGDALRRSDSAVASLTHADLRQALSGHPRIGTRPLGGAGSQAGGTRPLGGAGSQAGGAGSQAGGTRPLGGAGSQARLVQAEQAGVDHADDELMLALAEGNLAYERRFGHIYLVCATGRNGPALLALLRERLGNDPASEWTVVAAELAKINRIRLARQLRESG